MAVSSGYHIHARVVALIVADDEPRSVCVRKPSNILTSVPAPTFAPAARAGGELCQFYIRFHAHAPRCDKQIRNRLPSLQRSGQPLPAYTPEGSTKPPSQRTHVPHELDKLRGTGMVLAAKPCASQSFFVANRAKVRKERCNVGHITFSWSACTRRLLR